MFADSSVAIVEARYYDVESSLQAVERSGKELQYVVEWIRDNEQVVYEAVSRWGRALRWASEELRGVCTGTDMFMWF